MQSYKLGYNKVVNDWRTRGSKIGHKKQKDKAYKRQNHGRNRGC